MESLGDSARALANDGFAILPVHTPRMDGCSCRRTACERAGKHPRTRHGLKDATANVRTVERWWSDWPDANIGVATGNGLVVVDIDGDVGESQAKLLDLPPTLEVGTGSGRHLYYAGSADSRVRIRPGIDIRGDGAYIIVPPSRHVTGTVYRWRNDLPIAELPVWVMEPRKRTDAGGAQHGGRLAQIYEGERNDRLFRWACSMRNVGMTQAEIEAALDVTNAERCVPPLDHAELQSIAAAAAQNPVRRISDETLLDLKLGPIPTAVYLALRRCAKRDNRCWPSYDWLATQAGVGRTAVSEALPTLRDAGLLEWERRPNNSNLYRLLPASTLEEAR
jgi:hypothetical protein